MSFKAKTPLSASRALNLPLILRQARAWLAAQNPIGANVSARRTMP
jgi:hypothetical protein